jgi:hypothetical protein
MAGLLADVSYSMPFDSSHITRSKQVGRDGRRWLSPESDRALHPKCGGLGDGAAESKTALTLPPVPPNIQVLPLISLVMAALCLGPGQLVEASTLLVP